MDFESERTIRPWQEMLSSQSRQTMAFLFFEFFLALSRERSMIPVEEDDSNEGEDEEEDATSLSDKRRITAGVEANDVLESE